jgi:hypothetical protein
MRETQHNVADEYAGPSERSMKLTLTDFLGWLFIFISPVGITTLVSAPSNRLWLEFDWGAWWFTDVGRSFLKDANWLLPTFLALVLAFYAALIGQSLAKTNEEVVFQTRRRLVPAGLAVASIVVVFTASATIASAFTPAEWSRMPGIAATALAICLLGIGVGRFETRSHEDRLKVAKQLRKHHQGVLRRLPKASGLEPKRRGVVAAWTYGAVIIVPTVTVLIALLAEGSAPWIALAYAGMWLLVSVFCALLGLTLPVVLLESAYAANPKWKVLKKVGAAVMALWIASYTVIWLISAAANPADLLPVAPANLIFMLPGLTLWILIEVSLFASPRKFRPRFFAWTLHSAVIESVRRTTEKRLAALKDEIVMREKEAGKRADD